MDVLIIITMKPWKYVLSYNLRTFCVYSSGKEGPLVQALFDLLIEDMNSGPPTVRVPVPY